MTTPDTVKNTRYDSYLALVPRGLHHSTRGSILEHLSDFYVKIDFVGEPITNESAYVSSITNLLKDKNIKGRNKQKDVEKCCALPVGSIVRDKKHVSLGYLRESQPVWNCGGELHGAVWTKIETDAPVDLLANRLRLIGPLIALINVWENAGLSTSQSVEEATKTTESLVKSQKYPFQSALKLWHKHVKSSWGLSNEEEKEIGTKMQGGKATKYRLSCIRSDSEKYQYSRQNFLANVVDVLVPHQEFTGEAWKVDLTDFDLEVVLLAHSHALAVGIALRPYKQLGGKSFGWGSIPPDTSRPHLPGGLLRTTIRLRPSTAQMLLHLARLEPGDVVLDPCSGVGTIPMEVIFNETSAIGLGGDIALTPKGLGPLAAMYSQKAHATKEHGQADGSYADQMAWDSTCMPLRDACVDVIVSDLPFGKQCLSRNKLDQILPLVFSEMARVLRPKTGRMVLLCGAFHGVLQCLKQLNSGDDSLSPAEEVICMPCDSIFPVNIGGLPVWIVTAKRGAAKVKAVPNHRERARKVTGKRERNESCRKNDKGGNKRAIQKG